MKSEFKIGDKVIDSDGEIATVLNIWERQEAPNQIEIKYESKYSMLTDVVHECELKKYKEV